MDVAEIKVSYSTNPNKRIMLNNSKDTYNLILSKWDKDIIEFQEESKVIFVNRANTVLGVFPLSKGGLSGTVVDIRIILSVALKCHASGIFLVHNHPSGNLKPSEADRQITRKLKEACVLLDITLIDHLIITKTGYYSFADEGQL
jgi:DNA repair protein RadC